MSDGRSQVFFGARLFDGSAMRDDCALVVEDGVVAAIAPVAERPRGGEADRSLRRRAVARADRLAGQRRRRRAVQRDADARRDRGDRRRAPPLRRHRDPADRHHRLAGRARRGVGGGGRGGARDCRACSASMSRARSSICAARACTWRSSSGRCATATSSSSSPPGPARWSSRWRRPPPAPSASRGLAAAGIVVSLGHAEATAEEARAAFAAGARAVTHLFNAMSQLGSRAPGLVGAALADPAIVCGLIADGHHVHDAAMRAAINAKGRGGSRSSPTRCRPRPAARRRSRCRGGAMRRDGVAPARRLRHARRRRDHACSTPCATSSARSACRSPTR